MWYVYVLKSQKNDRLYIGMSEQPDLRLIDHNRGKVFSTKAYRPWKRVYIEEFETSDAARAREKYYKTGSGKEKLKFIVESKG